MSTLPTKIRVDIRDKFDAPTSPRQEAFKSLEETLGYKITCNPEWNLLWAALSESFPDKGTFVPCLVSLMIQWCEVLGARLEDAKFSEWADTFLEQVKPTGVRVAIVLELQVSTETDARPTTSWSAANPSTFVLRVPPEKTLAASQGAAPGFESDFAALFESDDKSAGNSQGYSGDQRKKDDDWAAVDEMGEEVQSIRISGSGGGGFASTSTQSIEALPQLDTLPRPEILFESLVPYILIIKVETSSKMKIECTHQPSLMLLSSYFKKWTKQDHDNVNRIPKLKVELKQSHFGLGQSYDTVLMEPYDDRSQRWTELSSVLVRGFVEGVLGYKLVRDNGNILTYHREIRFK